MLRWIVSGLILALPFCANAEPHLIEPGLRLAVKPGEVPAVALTFDACMGKVDHRILDTLVKEKIPSTIFVTARWLRHNPGAFETFIRHPDLFEIENHGAEHVPAIERRTRVYGIETAGSFEAVEREVSGGSEAIVKAGLQRPTWFRGATAKYTLASMAAIEAMGYRIAGYSINGDGGSLLGADGTRRRFLSAKDGDIIIAHINQPAHPAGDGVVAGIMELKKRGYHFLLLRDQTEIPFKAAAR